MANLVLWPFLLLLGGHIVLGFDFENANAQGVEWVDSTATSLQLKMDENNNEGITLVYLSNAQSPPTYVFSDGDQALLNLSIIEFEESTNKYEVVIGKSVDYEQITRFTIAFREAGQNDKALLLLINNLDDNAPTLYPSDSCRMDENTDYTATTSECLFVVEDLDGWLPSLEFIITGTGKGEDSLFGFGYRAPGPGAEATRADAYLILQDQQLDFENTTLYIFQVQAQDQAGNTSSSVQVIVEVVDLSDMPPTFTQINTPPRLMEETEAETFLVQARDGDFGINHPIKYRIASSTVADGLITINEASGEIHVGKIDRDADNINSITFVVVAYDDVEEDNTSETSLDVTFILDDMDDELPEFQDEQTSFADIVLDENYNGLVTPHDITDITINDKDLGQNAMYTVTLQAIGDQDFTAAFEILPNRGFGENTFNLNVRDPSKLDFEDPIWGQNNTLTLKIVSEGTENPLNSDSRTVTIVLLDLNDESPKFDSQSYTFNVLETTGIDEVIGAIRATDADAADRDGVEHILVGYLAPDLMIEEFGGDITTRRDDVFDFEKQIQVPVQIQATDRAGHVTLTQLTINVVDVNDEAPRLTVGPRIEIEENRPEGTVIVATITATDADAMADLEFAISWPDCRATKNSAVADFSKYENFIEIRTDKVDGSNQNVRATLTITDIVPGNTPDYEVFDTLYLAITVTDNNQTINTKFDGATVVINVLNVNDNDPQWTDSTKDMTISVSDEAKKEQFAIVTATDYDNLVPLTYSINPATDATPADWIQIDPITGALSIIGDITCDFPDYRLTLDYVITANDSERTADLEMSIAILDVNNKVPTLLGNGDLELEEDDNSNPGVTQDGKLILKIDNSSYSDEDRDDPYKTVNCQFSSTTSPEVFNRFQIVNNELHVKLSPGATLDREVIANFTFAMTCVDNYGSWPQNQVSPDPQFTIKLNDVNDNTPVVMPTTLTTNESAPLNTPIGTITGEDGDLGENGQITFELIEIRRFLDEQHQVPVENVSQELFRVETQPDLAHAAVIVNGDLGDQYGFLQLVIETTDGGSSPLSKGDNIVDVEVSKYNFVQPSFAFPLTDHIYLKPAQRAGAVLTMYNDNPLPDIRATDNQGDKFDLIISIESEDGSFDINPSVHSQARLYMTKDSNNLTTAQQITLSAVIDGTAGPGEASYSVPPMTVNIVFVDINSNPTFAEGDRQMNVTFLETAEGLSQSFFLKNASFAAEIVNSTEVGLEVFYLLRTLEFANLFDIDIKTDYISLNAPLDYEEVKTYQIVVQSSRLNTLDPSDNTDETKLTVTINVEDVNDNVPVFLLPDGKQKYFGTITVGTQGKVLSVAASDADSTSAGHLTYSIKPDSLDPSDSSISNVRDAFTIETTTGVINLGFDLQENMKGYFTFTVLVHDEDPSHEASAVVQIYIVTKDNTVNFIFENTLEEVINAIADIQKVLNDRFNYESNVMNPRADGARTIAPVYFIDSTENAPIEGSVILKEVTNVGTFVDLRNLLLREATLLLSNFDSNAQAEDNTAEILKAWLIGVSVVLGILCFVLLLALIFKTRSLSQRIKNLSSTKFGSQESGLNRNQGISVPTTNKHALEGTNPVYNFKMDEKEIDRESMRSGDSDFIGVEDNPEFDYAEEKNNNDFNFSQGLNNNADDKYVPRQESAEYD